MDDLIHILKRASDSERPVSHVFLPLVYDELRSFARHLLSHEEAGQTLQPTALVHEAWISISKRSEWNWNDRTHFFRSAAMAMRHILVDRAKAKGRVKRGGTTALPDPFTSDLAIDHSVTNDDRILLVDELMRKLEQSDPDTERLVSLKFFGGLSHQEIAAMEGVSERTIERNWAYAKAKMFRLMKTMDENEPPTGHGSAH